MLKMKSPRISSGTALFYSFGVNISGHTVAHEEVGAVATAD